MILETILLEVLGSDGEDDFGTAVVVVGVVGESSAVIGSSSSTGSNISEL